MAYDEELASRIRALIGDEHGLTEKKMFGGLAFLVGGNMAIAASGQGGALVHVGKDEWDELMAGDGAEPMVMRGKEMRGWIRVRDEALATDEALQEWVDVGVGHARSLPAK
jgi:hypothetical protein